MQDLNSVIATIKSLIEFKRDPSKGQDKKMGNSDKGEGDRDKSPKKQTF